MHLGFLSVCLGELNFEEKLAWASENGFSSIEAACWPKLNTRDYSSTDIDIVNFTSNDQKKILSLLTKYDINISSLAYYDNNLDSNLQNRQHINEHLKKCIDVAECLGVDMVGTFTGRDASKDMKGNFDEFERVFGDIVLYAQNKKVKIIIENCQMEGWQIPNLAGTISYSPELWEEMFKRVPNDNFGLNFDPSHLLIMQIDYIPLIHSFKDRIFHVHAKDAEIDFKKLSYYGVFNRQLGRELTNGYWRYRMPGMGQVDLKAVIDALKQIGYDGVLSIEHEDPIYEGSIEKVKEGLLLGRDYLKQFI